MNIGSLFGNISHIRFLLKNIGLVLIGSITKYYEKVETDRIYGGCSGELLKLQRLIAVVCIMKILLYE